MREALGHAEGLGDRERAVRAPHRQAADVARPLGDELCGDRAAELAVQAGERRVERRADVVDVAHEERAHAVARGSARARPRAPARRRGRRGRARAARPRPSPSSEQRAVLGEPQRDELRRQVDAASRDGLGQRVVRREARHQRDVDAEPREVGELEVEEAELAAVEHGGERLDLRAEARGHAAREHDGGDLAALDGGAARARRGAPAPRVPGAGSGAATSAAGTSIGSRDAVQRLGVRERGDEARPERRRTERGRSGSARAARRPRGESGVPATSIRAPRSGRRARPARP